MTEQTAVQQLWVAGRREGSDRTFEVRSPDDGSLLGVVAEAGEEQVERAVAAAAQAASPLGALPAHVRAAALAHVSARIAERAEEFAELITARERQAGEVGAGRGGPRGLDVPLGGRGGPALVAARCSASTPTPPASGRLALVRRFPRGPVLGISPFNFPLNLVAHKVAPALAVGAPIVLKPAPATPLSALLLGELLAETDLPAGMFSVLPCPNDRAAGAGRRPPAAGGVVHRLRAGRLRRSAGAVPRQARHPRAGRQRGGAGLRRLGLRRGPAAGRAADRHLRELPGRAVAASPCSGCSSTRRARRVPARGGRRGGRARCGTGDLHDAGDRRRSADRRRRGRAGRGVGRRGRRRRGHRAHRRHARRRDVRADRADRGGPPTPRCPARRSSGRSWSWSRWPTSTRRLRRVNDSRVRAAGRGVHPRPADGVPRRTGSWRSAG